MALPTMFWTSLLAVVPICICNGVFGNPERWQKAPNSVTVLSVKCTPNSNPLPATVTLKAICNDLQIKFEYFSRTNRTSNMTMSIYLNTVSGNIRTRDLNVTKNYQNMTRFRVSDDVLTLDWIANFTRPFTFTPNLNRTFLFPPHICGPMFLIGALSRTGSTNARILSQASVPVKILCNTTGDLRMQFYDSAKMEEKLKKHGGWIPLLARGRSVGEQLDNGIYLVNTTPSVASRTTFYHRPVVVAFLRQPRKTGSTVTNANDLMNWFYMRNLYLDTRDNFEMTLLDGKIHLGNRLLGRFPGQVLPPVGTKPERLHLFLNRLFIGSTLFCGRQLLVFSLWRQMELVSDATVVIPVNITCVPLADESNVTEQGCLAIPSVFSNGNSLIISGKYSSSPEFKTSLYQAWNNSFSRVSVAGMLGQGAIQHMIEAQADLLRLTKRCVLMKPGCAGFNLVRKFEQLLATTVTKLVDDIIRVFGSRTTWMLKLMRDILQTGVIASDAYCSPGFEMPNNYSSKRGSLRRLGSIRKSIKLDDTWMKIGEWEESNASDEADNTSGRQKRQAPGDETDLYDYGDNVEHISNYDSDSIFYSDYEGPLSKWSNYSDLNDFSDLPVTKASSRDQIVDFLSALGTAVKENGFNLTKLKSALSNTTWLEMDFPISGREWGYILERTCEKINKQGWNKTYNETIKHTTNMAYDSKVGSGMNMTLNWTHNNFQNISWYISKIASCLGMDKPEVYRHNYSTNFYGFNASSYEYISESVRNVMNFNYTNWNDSLRTYLSGRDWTPLLWLVSELSSKESIERTVNISYRHLEVMYRNAGSMSLLAHLNGMKDVVNNCSDCPFRSNLTDVLNKIDSAWRGQNLSFLGRLFPGVTREQWVNLTPMNLSMLVMRTNLSYLWTDPGTNLSTLVLQIWNRSNTSIMSNWTNVFCVASLVNQSRPCPSCDFEFYSAISAVARLNSSMLSCLTSYLEKHLWSTVVTSVTEKSPAAIDFTRDLELTKYVGSLVANFTSYLKDYNDTMLKMSNLSALLNNTDLYRFIRSITYRDLTQMWEKLGVSALKLGNLTLDYVAFLTTLCICEPNSDITWPNNYMTSYEWSNYSYFGNMSYSGCYLDVDRLTKYFGGYQGNLINMVWSNISWMLSNTSNGDWYKRLSSFGSELWNRKDLKEIVQPFEEGQNMLKNITKYGCDIMNSGDFRYLFGSIFPKQPVNSNWTALTQWLNDTSSWICSMRHNWTNHSSFHLMNLTNASFEPQLRQIFGKVDSVLRMWINQSQNDAYNIMRLKNNSIVIIHQLAVTFGVEQSWLYENSLQLYLFMEVVKDVVRSPSLRNEYGSMMEKMKANNRQFMQQLNNKNIQSVSLHCPQYLTCLYEAGRQYAKFTNQSVEGYTAVPYMKTPNLVKSGVMDVNSGMVFWSPIAVCSTRKDFSDNTEDFMKGRLPDPYLNVPAVLTEMKGKWKHAEEVVKNRTVLDIVSVTSGGWIQIAIDQSRLWRTIRIRVVNGRYKRGVIATGNVELEIFQIGSNQTAATYICDSDWDVSAALIACKLMGFGNTSLPTSKSAYGVPAARPNLIAVGDCLPSSTDFNTCGIARYSEKGLCDMRSLAGVQCT